VLGQRGVEPARDLGAQGRLVPGGQPAGRAGDRPGGEVAGFAPPLAVALDGAHPHAEGGGDLGRQQAAV